MFLKILEKIKKAESIEGYADSVSLFNEWAIEDFETAHKESREIRGSIEECFRTAVAAERWSDVETLDSVLLKNYCFSAPYFFDDYLQAVEYGKPYDKQFYKPRRHYLKRYVDAYQKVLDGELDFLSISMPKRCGKSQLGINFVDLISGKFPDKSTLMEGTGDDLVRSFYDGCLEYIKEPNDYHYGDIFTGLKLANTNADNKTFNLNKKSRFPTVMCRSIDSRQVGLSEATNLLYLDDCVEGREEAKDRNRLDKKWEILSGDIIGRAIEGTPIIICGTRYSLYDPIGHMQEEMRKQGKRMEIIETPALDPITDETNFEYIREGRKVFTTKYFRDQREMLTSEQFESEFQQTPFEAKGLMFPKDDLNYYFELPLGEPDAIIAACDTAEDGSDYCSMPVGYIFGDEVYIEDLVFDDAPAKVTKPEVAKVLIRNMVSSVTFESNNAGSYYARDVENILKESKYRCSVQTKRSISNKQARIESVSDNIIKHFYFKHPSTYKRGSQYDFFMRQVTTHTRSGKVPHDDAPDSLAMLETKTRMLIGSDIELFRRPF